MSLFLFYHTSGGGLGNGLTSVIEGKEKHKHIFHPGQIMKHFESHLICWFSLKTNTFLFQNEKDLKSHFNIKRKNISHSEWIE